MENRRLARALKLIRATEGIGVREMAKDIGISAPTLSRIENGKDVDLDSALKLFAWLLGRDVTIAA